MNQFTKHFMNFEDLYSYFKHKSKDCILVTYRKCENYEGMALSIMLDIDLKKERYILDLQWMSLGLDLYGDTLQESYQYQFEGLELLLDYLFSKYQIPVSAIPLSYTFDSDKFPNPIKDAHRKAEFEEAWNRFQHDFKKGIFRDTSLNLVYNSLDNL